MLRLANWIMGGRFNALVAAAILGFIPLIAWTSVSVVALVALRRNAAEAVWPLAGALMAATVQWNSGDVSHVGALLAAMAGALVLANTRSLAMAVVVTALAAALYLAALVQWMPERFDPVLAMFQAVFDQLKQAGEEAAFLTQIDLRQMVVELMGLLTGVTALAGLLLARSLQAGLYNPGGFREEFHQLRLAPGVIFALMLGMLLAQWLEQALIVAPLLLLPLILAGVGLVHGLAGLKPDNRTSLVLFYVVLVLFAGPAIMLLVAAATMDSFIDFRKRIGTARP
ncbi:MAG: hypothetical protein R3F47_12800 [Gammaproteobacteria bacterium]|jgi:hypothetical protein